LMPIEDGLTNLCGIVRRERLARSGFRFDHLLRSIAFESHIFADWLSNSRRTLEWLSCAPLIHGKTNCERNGIFHAGDAACFVEPFLGQGMALALAGGLKAAEDVIRDSHHGIARRFLSSPLQNNIYSRRIH